MRYWMKLRMFTCGSGSSTVFDHRLIFRRRLVRLFILRQSPLLFLLVLFSTPVSVFGGDIAAGKSAFMGRGCVGCHGVAGRSQIDIYPSLAGKEETVVIVELEKFRSQQRVNPTMNAMASDLSDDDIANIAAYLADQ